MLNDHDHWEQLIPDYLSGRLSDRDGQELKHHIAQCDRCSQLVEELGPLFEIQRVERSRQAPGGYFASVLPRIRQRLDRSGSRSRARGLPDLALAGASLVLLVAIFLSLWPPWQEAGTQDRALAEAIEELPAGVVADALDRQADQAGFIEYPSGGSISAVLSDKILEAEIVSALVQDRSALGAFAGASDSQSFWLSDLDDQEVTILLQRLSEREIL